MTLHILNVIYWVFNHLNKCGFKFKLNLGEIEIRHETGLSKLLVIHGRKIDRQGLPDNSQKKKHFVQRRNNDLSKTCDVIIHQSEKK